MNTLKSRWATVAVFCLLTALNGFQFQNFAGKVNIAKDVFSASRLKSIPAAHLHRRVRILGSYYDLH